MLSSIPGIEDISLTTNALLLERFAAPLAEAGLKRVNISLDTIRPERFARITRGGSFEQAWRGILAAEQAGLTPLKINVVAMRGINDDEFLDLARLSVDHPWQVRFIEIMPVKNEAAWGDGFPNSIQAFIPIHEIKERLASLDLQPVNEKSGSGPAREYRCPGRAGTDRLYLSRQRAFLRRVQPPAPDRRRLPAPLPAQRPGNTHPRVPCGAESPSCRFSNRPW